MSSERVTQEQAREALDLIRGLTQSGTAKWIATDVLRAFIAQHPDAPAADCAAEHAEARPTLYDWSGVPEWVMWIATDDNGVCCGFDVEPYSKPDGDGGYWKPDGDGRYWSAQRYNAFRINIRPDLAPNWRESLERRPT